MSPNSSDIIHMVKNKGQQPFASNKNCISTMALTSMSGFFDKQRTATLQNSEEGFINCNDSVVDSDDFRGDEESGAY
jgi:hypothetical protein